MKCPDCHRKVDEVPEGVQFLRVVDHLNYMKTATCPGSGRVYRLSIADDPIGVYGGSMSQLAAALLALSGPRGRQR